MIMIPEEAVSIEICATIVVDGKVETVKKTLDFDEVRKAIRDAEENYMEDDDEFVLTPEGERWLEEMQRKRDEEKAI